MLNSAVLDLAIGLVFAFSSVAFVASAIYEAIASLFKLRASSLLNGVKALVNDKSFTGLASALYNHALVNPRDAGTTAAGQVPDVKPSYIAPMDFAYAVVDTIQKGQATFAGLKTNIDAIQDEQLKQLLSGMYERANGKVEGLQAELASWFDAGMARVSGAYKRQAQLCTFLIAFVIAGLFNVDAFHLFRALWEHPTLTAEITASTTPDAAQVISDLRSLPVGWCGPLTVGSISLAFFGWLTTASSALFGAPFWFDLLQQFVNLRGTGQKPGEKEKKQ